MDIMERTHDGNDYRDFYDMPLERQQKLLDWIHDNLIKDVKLNPRHTSYSIKTFVRIGSKTDSWFSNGQMKGAMLEAGFKAGNTDDINWIFNVHEASLDWYDPHRWTV